MSDHPSHRQDELLASVLDGLPVDWTDAASQAPNRAEHRRVHTLKDISRIAEFCRGLQRTSRQELKPAAVPNPPAPGTGPTPSAQPMSPETARWGDLVLLEPLGAGGSGEVWRAWDVRLRREVALKFLRTPGGLAGKAGAALLDEARALARLRHPSVVSVHGIAEHDGRVGMWMELLRGETLAQRIEREGSLRQAEVARIGGELALALAAVHEAGLVHRDLKPGNVVLEAGDRVVLTDFGLGRRLDASNETWRIAGTPMFMAPELLAGEAATPRSDLYALGVTLRWALTGRPPFKDQTIAELRTEATRGPSTPLLSERPHLSATLVAAIERAMAPSVMDRFASAADFARALAGDQGATPAAQARHTLPGERDAFVGREAELEELEGRLEIGSRLVTLAGTGGMGKTRLAVRYGWQRLGKWPGGVWFCDLTEARSVNGIASAVAGSLGVPLGKGDSVAQLGYAMAGRGRCLVILDNFEQVSVHADATLGQWLERAPDARFLVTSRERLNIRGEEVQQLEPLAPAPGVALFIERARRVAPDFVPQNPEISAIQEIVRLAEGMPLAIELAAARVRMLSVEQVLGRMRERFRLLSSPGGGRHASLEAMIDESWELLEEWEKAAWAQCAVFEGGFTIEAAEAVLDLAAWPEAPWVVDVLQALVDKNLLRRSTSDARSAGASEGRLGMYVTLQEYARTKLGNEGAIAKGGSGQVAVREAEERHGRWFARYGSEKAFAILQTQGNVKIQRLQPELENLMAACRRAVARNDGPTAAGTYLAFWRVLEWRGPFSAALDIGRDALRIAHLERGDEANILRTLGQAEWWSGMADEGGPHLEAALAIASELGDRRLECRVYTNIGTMHCSRGRLEEAKSYLEKALAAARDVDYDHLASTVLSNLGIAYRDLGQMDEARSHFEMALELARKVGYRRMEGTVLGNLGLINQDQGRVEEARSQYGAALAIHREVGNLRFEGNILGNLGSLNLDQGRMEEAQQQIEAALAIHREVGDRRSLSITLTNLGTLRIGQGRMEEARAALEEALALHREFGNRRLEGNSLGELARMHHQRGELEEARAHYERALAIHREWGDRRYEGAVLGRLGSLLHAQGALAAARDAITLGEQILREVNALVELGILLCARGELECATGNRDAARATLAEAEKVAGEIESGPHSELGSVLGRLRRTLGVTSSSS